MSREALDYHWGKHHRTYVENLDKQIVKIQIGLYCMGERLSEVPEGAWLCEECAEEAEKQKQAFWVDRIDFASFGFGGIGCVSSRASDGYNISKLPSCSAEDIIGEQLKNDLKALDEKSSLTGSSSASKKNSLRLPSQAKQASHSGESEDGKAETVNIFFTFFLYTIKLLLPITLAMSTVQAIMSLGLIYYAVDWPGRICVVTIVIGMGYGAHWAIAPASVSDIFP